MISMLEATVIKVVKYGSESMGAPKVHENLLDVFQRNCQWIVLGRLPRLTVF